MAASDARPIPRKNTAFRLTVPIFDADGDPATGATSLDSEVSLDGAAFADCTSEATEIGSTGIYYLDLTASEMNADTVVVQVKTATSGAKTSVIVMYPEEAGDIRADVVQISGDSAAADNLEAAADGTGYNLGGGSVVAASVTGAVASVTGAVGSVTGAVGSVAGNVGGNVTGSVGSVAAGGITASSIAADAIGASELAADAVAEIAAAISIPSAATVADAVWDEAIAGHLTAGTTGHYLDAAGGAADPMDNAASGYASGTLGYIISQLQAGRVTVQSLLTQSGDMSEIVSGADYNASDGASFDWTNSTSGWPTLSGATVTWEAVAPNGETASYAMSVTDGANPGQTVRLQLTTANTAALAAAHVGIWEWAVWAVLASSSRKVRLVRGIATVVDGPGPAA